MDEKKNEANKKYNNSFGSVLFIVQVVTVVALLGYWCIPTIVNSLQMVTVWFTLILRNILVVFFLVNALIVSIYVSFSKSTEINKPDLYDQYYAAVPTVVRTAPKYNYYRVTEVEDGECNHSNNKEIVPVFQAVKESSCYDHQEVKEMNSKSYRRTRSEKKKKSEKRRTKVEYRRTESERVTTKTASWMSQTIDGLSREEFRMTVETFITEKKKTLLRENDVVDQRQHGVVQWQGSRDNGIGRHSSPTTRRLLGASASNCYGPYLAISN